MLDTAYNRLNVGHKDVSIDDNGIIMAAVQALYKKFLEQEKIIAQQELCLKEQEQAISRIKLPDQLR
ncbi:MULTISPECIES: hypothetical protein [Moorena]|uniref:Uncharacterized protein n=2 Tax=Moorena producens TaxID=1155739 RepID=A0A1D9G4D5_MOOP1|nr:MULTISPECIES: hypothetical protein [Moorena]NEQ17439.1 hypothetical protein [Moorena sp. SIO3E2]NES84201.1 hypothetical protein [Moorena sp. SIO2B7]AOY82507.1 hypothetical protein BJP36_23930 [Moorena producens JHB]EGJ34590.1 hypothetical protein LYNGBM3L_14510 [Moorena producens 3L]NEP32275.1 hypothetical protein [Moorena sp. SIO3B2]